jgi:hypothetical protein
MEAGWIWGGVDSADGAVLSVADASLGARLGRGEASEKAGAWECGARGMASDWYCSRIVSQAGSRGTGLVRHVSTVAFFGEGVKGEKSWRTDSSEGVSCGGCEGGKGVKIYHRERQEETRRARRKTRGI